MAAWFHRPKYTIIRKEDRAESKVPEGMWVKCDKCQAILLKKELDANYNVCPKCGLHGRLSARRRVELLADAGTFTPMFEDVSTVDYLGFPAYMEKVQGSIKKTNLSESVLTGTAKMNGMDIALGVTDFSFMGGSLGSVMGERLTALVELAIKQRVPVIIVSASGGGARMQEGIISLMQMAKISAGLSKLADARIPYISVMTDPTGGGVTASFAMLGDLNVAEPDAFIMFAGPRVIEQTIKQKLPAGFQRAEFLQEHGMIDMIVSRLEMKEALYKALGVLTDKARYKAAV